MAKLMLVEDDNNLREIYEARLMAEGYDIVSAKDGEEALVVAKAEKPDLIISDVMMPKISGFEMLDILRNTEGLKDVKVIMLTALGQSDDQQRADRLGADRYLVKSQVTLEDIVKVAHDLLQDDQNAGTTPPAAPEPPTPPASPEPPTVADPDPSATTPPTPPAATDDPASSPAAVAVTAPAPVAPAVTTPPAVAPESAAATVTANDDKLMTDAVDKLLANTDEAEPKTEEPTPEPTTAPVVAEAPETPVAASADSSATDAELDTTTDQVPIAHKKVITPLDSVEKKDIAELLAVEEAKEAAAQGPAPPTAVIATDEAGEKTEPLTAEVPPPIIDSPDDTEAVEATPPDTAETPASPVQTTAQEEAAVETKIEDFVAGATTEASTPTDITMPAALALPVEEPVATNPTDAKPTIGKVTSATVPVTTTDTDTTPPVTPVGNAPAAPAASAITGQADPKNLAVKPTTTVPGLAADDPNSIAL